MRKVAGSLIVCACVLLLPAAAWAQASITGVVRDTSGAVLPGVTVEATSAALIEKVRTSISDSNGQYRIDDLRPGTYTLTFTLTGFNVIRRDGLELSGGLAATVNAEMPVGGLEETITVSGAAPVVDVTNVRRQQTVTGETLREIPSSRAYNGIVMALPAVQTTTNDVGGINGPGMALFTVHGGRANEGRLQVDGINAGFSLNGAGVSGYVADVGNAQEVVFSSSGGLGEAEVGGPFLNIVPRTGGNRFSGSYFGSFGNDTLQGQNTQDLVAAGVLAQPAELIKIWDISAAVGGPIFKDRLWFFTNARHQGNRKWVTSMWENANAYDPSKWTYEPDLDAPVKSDGTWKNASARITLQASPRNKVDIYWDEQGWCTSCQFGGSRGTSPEATGTTYNYPSRFRQVTWRSPTTSRLLLEAGYGGVYIDWGTQEHYNGNPTRDLIRVQDQGGAIPNINYRSMDWTRGLGWSNTWRASAAYVTGSHSMKVGYQGAFHLDDQKQFTNNHRLSYRLNNGVPNRLTMSAGGFNLEPGRANRTRYDAFYVQDQWTMGRLTLQGGLRYDHAWSWFPEQQIGPDRFLPVAIRFDRQPGVVGFHDLTPRGGMAYDVFGTGRTSLKVNAGKYLEPASNASRYNATNPMARVILTTNRAWTDGNRDYVADCDLMNPAANGECGPWDEQRFGSQIPGTVYDPRLLDGWGVRPWDAQFGVSVQQELMPRVAVDVGYHRRWFGTFSVTDNLAVTRADYDRFSLTAPLDSRLPDGGGYVINDLYNVSNARFGQSDNYVLDSDEVGSQREYWQGVDVTLNARLPGGLTFQGGTSTGRRTIDTCELREALPETAAVNPYCRVTEGLDTQFRGLAAYTIPRADVLVSGTFRSTRGPELAANWVVPGAVVAQTLGRPLSGGAANVTVNLVAPGELYGERLNQMDVRIAKVLRLGGMRANVGVDIYNALNANTITGYDETFNPANSNWLRPTTVLTARWAKLSFQLDF